MKFLMAGAIVCLHPVAYAQDVPDPVLEIIKGIEEDTGVSRFGATRMDQLDDGDNGAMEIAIDPSKFTFIHIEGDEYTLGVKAVALAGSKEVARSAKEERSVTLQIPPGSGSSIRLQVGMSCEQISCGYFVQAFVR
jgi:hypothetical protein